MHRSTLGGGLLDLDADELVHGESFAPDRTFFNIQGAEERQERQRGNCSADLRKPLLGGASAVVSVDPR